jgi:hypothetical protein
MSLEYKDLVELLKPCIHVDAFESKLGDPDDIIVISFFVRDDQAAKDLVHWMDTGYDFIVDSDKSPGEIKPNRYLVYVEIRRRSNAGQNVWQLLSDLNTLTEFDVDDWEMVYKDKTIPFTKEDFDKHVPLTPKAYRKKFDKDLNEVRAAAGLPLKTYYEKFDPELQDLRARAGY